MRVRMQGRVDDHGGPRPRRSLFRVPKPQDQDLSVLKMSDTRQLRPINHRAPPTDALDLIQERFPTFDSDATTSRRPPHKTTDPAGRL